ncbi:MAG: MFS transporter, partial [Phycisphaerales bacterium]|nr:MFS transporter [Phycisphaerales bacterium]
MAHARYLTAPANTTSMPTGIPYIIGNEAAERFSFYGMKTILAVFMTQYLMTGSGAPAYLSASEARENVAWFVAGAYFFPIFGALLADIFLGKYRTIILLSLVYCLGHAALACIDLPSPILQATFEPKTWLIAGLLLIAIGAGGIKPCVSAHVGDQFGQANKHLLTRVFGWFYFSINFGSFFSTLLTPYMLKQYGPGWAFGIPGVLMAVATFMFWLGRHRYAHIPPKGIGFVKELVSTDGLLTLARLAGIYVFVAVFWALYDQTGGAWVLQAAQMNCHFLGIDWLESQIQAVNPLLILIFIPLFSYLIYPALGKVVTLTPLRKIGAGLFLCVAAFVVSATAQARIDVAQAKFHDEVAPMVASSSIDYAKTLVELTALERNATASALTKLIADPKPSDSAWTAKVSKELSIGGIAIGSDGKSHNADWPSIAWQIFAYIV